MATFLQLAQKIASESGTIEGTLPTTVTGQTKRLGKIVRWTNDAWRAIQNAHASWKWMRSDFSGSTVAAQRLYTGAQMGISTRFAEWINTGNADTETRYSSYLAATGVADEGQLQFVDWDTFYSRCMRGTQTNGRPIFFSVSPDNQLALHPIPDAVYTIRGPYRKDVQDLTADGDIPEMPVRFHDVIMDVALASMLTIHDEAQAQIGLYRLRQIGRFCELERDQLPRITMGPALA